MLLDTAFTTTPVLHPFPIFYLAHTSHKAITATRTMLEWLSQDINVQDNPLTFKYVKIVTHYNELVQGNPGPRVVIVDSLDIATASFAHQAFLDFKSGGHLLLLTSQSVPRDSLAYSLLQQWDAKSPSLSPETPRLIVSLSTSAEVTLEQRIPLQGDDLIQWKRADRLNREQKDADLFFEERQRNLLEGTESDSDEDEEDQLILDSDDGIPGTQRIRGSTILLQESTYDFWLGDGLPGIRASLKHFPFIDRRKRFDEFGMTLKPDEFVRVEDEIVPTRVRDSGGKRKWDEVDTDVEDIPARLVRSRMAIDINVRVGYVDLEGLHDGRAAGNLLPRLNARKMVLAPRNIC